MIDVKRTNGIFFFGIVYVFTYVCLKKNRFNEKRNLYVSIKNIVSSKKNVLRFVFK